MLDFEKIVFPVDHSERSRAARPYVEVFAARFASEVILLHVVEPPFSEVYGPIEEARADVQDAQLQAFAFNAGDKVKVSRRVVVGEPARAIVETTQSLNAGLIMMPTHGYGGFRRFLIGSVTAKVLHDAQCAVWTTAHVEELPSPAETIREIVCALALDEKALPVLSNATELANFCGARLTLVHAIPAHDARPHAYFDEQLKKYLFDTARMEISRLTESVGVQPSICLEGGEVAKVVRHAAEQSRADLVVIGRSETGLLGRLRTHAYAIIRDSPCPVLSL